MRIVCRTVEAFVENLRLGEVFEKSVWLDETGHVVSEHKILCNLQASAVVRLRDGGEFLLQYGEDVGYDYTDGEAQREGSEAAMHRKGYLRERCEDMGLTVRPGIVSE
jgi:hypothetical protein